MRRQLDWPLPHKFFANKKKTLPNPFGTSHPVLQSAQLPIETPLAQAYGALPNGISRRISDGEHHFRVTRRVVKALEEARDALQQLIMLGDFGNYERQRQAWEHVVDATWVLATPPQRPSDGVGWPMPELAWRAALRRQTGGAFTFKDWKHAEPEIRAAIAFDVSDEIVAKAKGVSRQAIAKQRSSKGRPKKRRAGRSSD